MGYEALVITESSRKKLLSLFPPKHPDFIGHHVTLNFGVPARDESVYGGFEVFHVVGYAVDDKVEALVVKYQNTTNRPDGNVYHITWSIDRSAGAKPVHSNELIKRVGYDPVQPIMVTSTLQYLK